jgi:Ca2+-binding RTX toxin-like protein
MSDGNLMDFTKDQVDHIIEMLRARGLWDFDKGEIINVATKQITTVGAFSDIYKYIAGIIDSDPNVDKHIKYWFSKAPDINADNRDVPADNYIRGATQYGLEFNGKVYGLSQSQIDQALQLTSNLIGQNVIQEIINAKGMPVFPRMLSGDISAAIGNPTLQLFGHNLQQTIGGWGGAFYYWDEPLHYKLSSQTSVGSAINNGIKPESPGSSLIEFFYTNSNAMADYQISQATLALPSGGGFLGILPTLSRLPKMARDAWDSFTSGIQAEAPPAVKARLFRDYLAVLIARIEDGKYVPGPHSPLTPASVAKVGNAVTSSFGDNSSITQGLSSDDGVAQWKDSSGNSGIIKVTDDGTVRIEVVDIDKTVEVALINPNGRFDYEKGDGARIATSAAGQDTLYGGQGDNTYALQSLEAAITDTIKDQDGQGKLYVGSAQISGEGAQATTDPNTWVAADGTRYQFTSLYAGAKTGKLTISGGGVVGDGQIILDGFDLDQAESNPNGYLGIRFSEKVALAAGPGTDPFASGNGSVSNIATTIKGGAVQAFTAFVSAASDTVQSVTIKLAGGDFSAFKINTGAGFIDFGSDGTATLTIPAGSDRVTVGLVYAGDPTKSQSATLTSTITDGSNATGTASNTLTVTFDNSGTPQAIPPDSFTQIAGVSRTGTSNGQSYPYTLYQGDDKNDLVQAGDGQNKIILGDGNNSVIGGVGDDDIAIGNGHGTSLGNSTIHGGGGHDFIFIDGGGNNLITGDGGQDIIYGGSGHDRIYAGSEVDLDTALEQAGEAKASGQKGNALIAGYGDSTIVGGTGNDLIALGGNDLVVAGPGNDTIYGGVAGSGILPDWSIQNNQIDGVLTRGGIYYHVGLDSTTSNVVADASYEGNLDVSHDVNDPNAHDAPVGGGNDTIFGGTGNHLIMLSNGDNYVDLGSGNSTVWGGMGQNTIFGGTGNVFIFGGGGDTYIDAESGNDTIIGGAGNNTIFGGSGKSVIFANKPGSGWGKTWVSAGVPGSDWATLNQGDNYVEAGSGDTIIYGSGGNDTLVGGDGSDKIFAGDGNTTIEGGDGVMQIKGGAGNDVIDTGDGGTASNPDVVVAGSGNTTVYGGQGIDHIFGGSGKNVLYAGDGGTAGAPTYVTAGDGDTTIHGGSGIDYLFGGKGANVIYAGDGGAAGNATKIVAGSGDTTVYGGFGVDYIWGGSGKNVLYAGDGGTQADRTQVTAGSGETTLVGGAGHDVLIGGSGKDIFVISSGDIIISGSKETDTVAFASGTAPSDLMVSAVLYDDGTNGLVINGGAGQATIVGGMSGGAGQFQFADTTRSLTQLLQQSNLQTQQLIGQNAALVVSAEAALRLAGGTGNDTIYGVGANDTLVGGAGTSVLSGGGGNATYVVNAAGSQTTINNSVNTDTLQFGAGVTVGTITAQKNVAADGTVSVTLNAGQGTVVINAANGAGLSQVLFADGTTSTLDDLIARTNNTTTVRNADGSYSTTYNDGHGNVTTNQYDKNGIKTGDTWARADGSHGADTFNSDGSSSGSTTYADGSSLTYTRDTHGNAMSINFDALGHKTGDRWTRADGSFGSDTFNADGSSSGVTHYADGSRTVYTNDGHGDIDTLRYDATGVKIGEVQSFANGAVRTDDGHGDVTITFYDSNHVRIGDAWTRADGSHGSDAYNPDGSSSGVTYQSDGSYSTYANDGRGHLVTKFFTWDGNPNGWSVSDTSTLTSYYTQAGVHYKDVVLHADGTAETISLNSGTTIGFNGNGAFSDRDWEAQFDYTDFNHFGDIQVHGWSTPEPFIYKGSAFPETAEFMIGEIAADGAANTDQWRRTA